jgi:opacity protein-like surface antigen
VLNQKNRKRRGHRQRQDAPMKTFLTACLGVSLCLAAVAASSSAADAGAVPGRAIGISQPSATFAQYRGDNYGRRYDGGRRYGYRRNYNGRNIGIGIGAAIIGGIILNEAARAEHRSSHGSQWSRCEETYRSFEPSTGMYTGYDGERHTCPYLN